MTCCFSRQAGAATEGFVVVSAADVALAAAWAVSSATVALVVAAAGGGNGVYGAGVGSAVVVRLDFV